MKLKMFFTMITILAVGALAWATLPTLNLKNQFGEQSINYVTGGNFVSTGTAPANTIFSNLTGSTAVPTGNTYAAVAAKLPSSSILLTGFSASAGTISPSDSVLVGFNKLAGNVAAHQADSTATDVAGLVADFNALLAKLQAAHLMAP